MAEDTPAQEKATLVCRDQSDLATISDWFGDELLDAFNIFSDSPDAVPCRTSMRSCIIVVDARAMKDEFSCGPAETPYKDLLKTIRETVGKISVLNLFVEGLSRGA